MAKTKDNKKPEKKPDFFEKYGEVGSAMELNLAIEGFLEENDTTSMKEFAAENGFTEKDVDRWVKKREQDPDAKFCNDLTAALAKLSMEGKADDELDKIADFMGEKCEENRDLARAVRKKGKRLKAAYKKMYDFARDHKTGSSYMMTDDEGYVIMRDYYLEVAK